MNHIAQGTGLEDEDFQALLTKPPGQGRYYRLSAVSEAFGEARRQPGIQDLFLRSRNVVIQAA